MTSAAEKGRDGGAPGTGAASVAVSTFQGAHVEMLVRPRQLLAGLRDIMAGGGGASDKLDKIVRTIAREMRADVCSCYVRRPGELLELFATVGLRQEAVHKTRLRVGQGIVGEIAAAALPLAVSDVKSHPAFVYCPETGEDIFNSLCGVPVLRGSKVRGVLVIQNVENRLYGEETVETLQTAAMLVAELVASGELVARDEAAPESVMGLQPANLKGASLARGLAMGQAVLYEPSLTVTEMVTDNPALEKKRLRAAVAGMQQALDKAMQRPALLRSGAPRDILEAYRLFARDRGWIARIEETIGKGLTAEAAVLRVQNETRARLMQINDPYIRNRLSDVEDLSSRLLTHLGRKARTDDRKAAAISAIILVARDLGPAALLDFEPGTLKGLVLESGADTNHAAIVARALGIPVVGQCMDILSYVHTGDLVVVDGDAGVVYLRPSDDVATMFARSIALRAQRQMAPDLRDRPPVTRDGKPVSLQLNMGMMGELPLLEQTGAEGIGLFRTEIAFMDRKTFPGTVAQTAFYSSLLQRAAGRPVTFRLMDIGGDKPLPYFDAPKEENPALGWRALRIGIDRPAILRVQFRALMRAHAGKTLRVMLPMVTEMAELRLARKMMEMEAERAARAGRPGPDTIALGVMLEVPALLWQMDALLREVDFISVGTNDLMQYLFAADRSNGPVRKRYDALSPAMLAVMDQIAAACNKAGCPVTVCGEMAADPLEAMALVTLGFSSLSVSPAAYPAVKAMLTTLDTEALRPCLRRLMEGTEHSLRPALKAFALDHGVDLGAAADAEESPTF